MTDIIFGGDINIFSVEKASLPKIDEKKMRQVLNTFMVENGGKVLSYSMNSGSIKR